MTAVQADEFPLIDPSVLPPTAVIAIDGPAGSGKSTTALALADTFGLLYIDSGAMYRALTHAALVAGIDPGDEDALAGLLTPVSLVLKPARGEVSVFWNGKDVSKAIRTPEVDANVSLVSSHPAVRSNMVERQKIMGRLGGVVMEGRDIGTVVFPLATAKIFLSASLEARVERRYRQYQHRGLEVSREELRLDLAERDRQDSERLTSPLTISPDAMVIDSSDLTLEQQNRICARACLVNPALDLELDTDFETAFREIPWHYRLPYAFFSAAARFYDVELGPGLREVVGAPIDEGVHARFPDPADHIALGDLEVGGGELEVAHDHLVLGGGGDHGGDKQKKDAEHADYPRTHANLLPGGN